MTRDERPENHSHVNKLRAERLRRAAIQIAAQLPDDRDEAIEVLGLASDLVLQFLHREDGGSPPPGRAALRAI